MMTYTWLDRAFAKVGYSVLMKEDDDFRDDWEFKKELYENYISLHFVVDFVLEDRDSTAKMYRELGLTCLQVESGEIVG